MKRPQYLKKMDKSAISVSDLNSSSLDETEFWLSKSPEERFIALEILRQRFFDYARTSKRLQRVFEVIDQTPR
jgi:hypothetical protein